jgi:hypothetical protein
MTSEPTATVIAEPVVTDHDLATCADGVRPTQHDTCSFYTCPRRPES